MPAPKGNRFWELRSKHGRDKLFTSPELLWQAACEYFEWCENNPLYKSEAKVISGFKESGSVEIVDVPLIRAFTIQGLCSYLGCNTAYFRNFKLQNHDHNKDFSAVITHIEEIIYNQKFSGAASGIFNSNIIARDLGLTEKTDLTTKGESINQVFKIGKQEFKF